MTTKRIALGLLLASVSLLGCPKVPSAPNVPGRGKKGVDPNACGKINTSDVGRKLYTFLAATAELQLQMNTLEKQTRDACLAMGGELAMPAEQLEGATKDICHNVATTLKSTLDGSIKAGARFEVVSKPAVCVVDARATAEMTAECEGKASADVAVYCEGSCQGTCNGACEGTCSAKNTDGSCAGQCDGTCKGGCSGGCQGTADVQAEAECEAAAEVHASLAAECTPPEIEVRYDASVVTDAAKLDMAKRAIEKGLKDLLVIAQRMKGVAKAVTVWARAAADLARSSGQFASAFGDAAMCVSGQIAAAFSAVATIEVQVEVSVEASAEVGGSCGAGT